MTHKHTAIKAVILCNDNKALEMYLPIELCVWVGWGREREKEREREREREQVYLKMSHIIL